MNFVRRTLLVLITPIFTFLLFATATDMGVVRVVTHPANIKKMLTDSGVYSNAVPGLLDQAKQISDKDNGGGDVPLTDPAIRSAATAVFTPQVLQSTTETVIDSVYGWLDGKTSVPNFSIDLTPAKTQFAAAVAKSAQDRAATLPACTAADTPSDFDPLSASCLPAGVSPAAAGAKIQTNILSGKGFLDHPIINADSVKAKGSNQSVFADQLKDTPKQYQHAKKTPVIFAVTTILLATAMVFLGATRRAGLRHLGILVLIVGLFMLVFSYGLNYAVTQKAVPNIKLDNAVLQKNVRSLVTSIEQKVDQNYWIFGGIYTVLGAGAIVAATRLGGGKGPKSKTQLEGEGKNRADRIDLREPDRVSSLTRPPKKPGAKKTIKIQ